MRDTALSIRAMGPVEWTLLVGLSVLWGGSFFFFEVGLRELPPFTLVLGRVGLAAAVLLTVVYASGRRMPADPKVLGGYLLLGGINNALPFSLIVWGQTEIPSGLASIL
ncbi:MAG: DMT family transporter, partial [Ectothiorhodospiraceae bacterium]